MTTKKTPEPKSLKSFPGGIEIAYFLEPKRIYKVRHLGIGGDVPQEEWREVPSVTTVLKVLDKPALPWWGMRVGIAGVAALIEEKMIRPTADGKIAYLDASMTWQYFDTTAPALDGVEKSLTRQKLTVNHVLDKASDRGVGVHDALEAWAKDGTRPDPDKLDFATSLPVYAEEERQYVRALQRFVDDMGDAWETDGIEVTVGSVGNGFAGRYDLRGRVTKDVTLITQALTKDGKSVLKKGVKTTTVPGGTKLLVDLKSSKSIYSSHLLQLEAYEGAGVECGLEATDARAVLHVSALGHYQFKRARATYEEFLSVLSTYNALERIKEEAL